MKKIKLFEQFIQDETETEIRSQLGKLLHAGIKMIPVSRINEGSVDHAKYELDRMINKATSKGETPIVQEFVPEIMALVQKFADSGQSGGSAPFTSGALVQTLQKLLAQEPLGGVDNDPDEWGDEASYGSFQNHRLSSVFKETKDSKPYYLNAIVFVPEGKEYGYTSGGVMMEEGSEETVGSFQYIKTFPFEPKTFKITVHEREYRKLKDGTLIEEEGGGWWESWLADPKQLDQVWEYYDRYDRKK
jgi:hypothetical protein